MEHPADAITCVAAFEDRVFTGDASGAVRCYNATATDGSSRESEATRAAGGAEAQAEAQALPLSKPLWEAHGVAQGAILVSASHVRSRTAQYRTVMYTWRLLMQQPASAQSHRAYVCVAA